jgi:hypothetical protein
MFRIHITCGKLYLFYNYTCSLLPVTDINIMASKQRQTVIVEKFDLRCGYRNTASLTDITDTISDVFNIWTQHNIQFSPINGFKLKMFQPLCLVAGMYCLYWSLYSTLFHLWPKLWILTVTILIYLIGNSHHTINSVNYLGKNFPHIIILTLYQSWTCKVLPVSIIY